MISQTHNGLGGQITLFHRLASIGTGARPQPNLYRLARCSRIVLTEGCFPQSLVISLHGKQIEHR